MIADPDRFPQTRRLKIIKCSLEKIIFIVEFMHLVYTDFLMASE